MSVLTANNLLSVNKNDKAPAKEGRPSVGLGIGVEIKLFSNSNCAA